MIAYPPPPAGTFAALARVSRDGPVAMPELVALTVKPLLLFALRRGRDTQSAQQAVHELFLAVARKEVIATDPPRGLVSSNQDLYAWHQLLTVLSRLLRNPPA